MHTNRIIFDKPADGFTSSLLIGNGRLGACVYGEVLREQVVLNESSMWSGSRENTDREGANVYLPEIRRLLREGKNYEAQNLFSEHFTCSGKGSSYAHGTDVPFGCYQTLGRLHLSYFQAVSHGRQDSCGTEGYRRYLDLEEATAVTTFRIEEKTYKRTYLVSEKYQAIVLHFTCSKEHEIDFAVSIDRDECFSVEGRTLQSETPDAVTILLMKGQLAGGYETDQGIRYASAVAVKAINGTVFSESGRLHVKEADEAYVYVTAATDLHDFMGKPICEPESTAIKDIQNILMAEPSDILTEHRRWYQKQYETFSIDLTPSDVDAPASEDTRFMTTAERIRRFLSGEEDPSLLELYIQNARYQMISSSQKGGFAANLQGIWADEILTPWNGDWHLNAQQMIYWLTEKANLTDHTLPFLKLTEELVKPGERTAKIYYNADGWLAHTFTNPWGFTSPAEDASWGSTTGSPAWQCHHLWEHYLYTLDKEYLKWAYPIMKGAARFYIDNLVTNEEGYLVTSPSSSPENAFLDEQGRVCSLCEGPTYDRTLVASLFQYCLQAQYILCDDLDFSEELERLQKKLAPIEIAEDGRIREWGKDYQEAYPYHRHLSHLWGLYPGSMISREHRRDLAEAAEKSLIARGRTTAGWAIAYRGILWARLRNSENAFSCVLDTLRLATGYNLMNLAYHCDETEKDPKAPDLEYSRYPFQLDGNQGTATSLLTMILDDETCISPEGKAHTTLYLLPALPDQMKDGTVHGMRTKGGYEVDLSWKDKNVTSMKISAASSFSEKQLKVVIGGRENDIRLYQGSYEETFS